MAHGPQTREMTSSLTMLIQETRSDVDERDKAAVGTSVGRYGLLRRLPLVVVILATVFCLALALASLTNRSLWIDEAFTEAVATAPTDQFLDDLSYNGGNMSL